MEIPDNIGEFISFPIVLDILKFNSSNKTYISKVPIIKKAHFRATGRVLDIRNLGYKLPSNETPYVYEYVLVDID